MKVIFSFHFDQKNLLAFTCLLFPFFLSRFDDENGVIIEGWFPKDFKCEAIPWNSEDKFAMIGNDLFPVGFKFETDIFDIKETKTGHPIDINETPAENVLIKTPLLTKDAREEMYYQYRGAVQFADILKFVEPITEVFYIIFKYCILFLYFVSEHRRHNGIHNSQAETVITFVKYI